MTVHSIRSGRDAQVALGAGDGVYAQDDVTFHDGATLAAARPPRRATAAAARDDFPARSHVVSNGSVRATLRRGVDADRSGAASLTSQHRRETQSANLAAVARSIRELPLPASAEERIRALAAPPTLGEIMRSNQERRVSPTAWGIRAGEAVVHGVAEVGQHVLGHVAASHAGLAGAAATAGVGVAAAVAVVATGAALTIPVAESFEDGERALGAAARRQVYDDQVRAMRVAARRSEAEGRAAAHRLDVTSSSALSDEIRQRLTSDGDFARAFRATISQRIDRGQLESQP